MRRILKSTAALALITAAPGLVSVAFAHGGSYRGPAGEVPPDSREPSDPPPPPEGGGPSTPGGEPGGGPTTGGPDAGGPSTPGGGGGGGGGPSTGGGGGPSTGGGGGGGPSTGGNRPKQGKGAGYEDWTFWWNYNKDEILQLKSAVKKMQMGPHTGGGGFNRKGSGQAVKSATDEAIQNKIVPVMHALLEGKDVSFHIQSASELGLAKIGDVSIIETLQKMATNEGKAYHREVQETAGLAFGLLQQDTPATRAFLIEIVKDQKNDGTFIRPFSAISLGLLGDKNDRDHSIIGAMVDVLSHKESGQDVKPACLAAIGLLGDDFAVQELLTIVQTGKTSQKGSEALGDTDVSYAISALGKIGRVGLDGADKQTAVLDAIVGIAESKEGNQKVKRSQNEKRSAAIALGQLGPVAEPKVQAKVVDVLQNVAEEASDNQEKNFAIISMGRMGAAKGVDEKVRGKIMESLKKSLERGKGFTPSFAALALGLIGRTYADEGKSAPEEEIRLPIRKRFEEKGDTKSKGAYAVASGLVKDPLAVDALKKALMDKSEDKTVRGYCALGLGMIGAADALEAVKSALDDSDRNLRVQAAMAAGLLGDRSVIIPITNILKSKDSSNYELGSAALALGQIGDEDAISVLVDIAKDDKKEFPDLTRALAVVALGQIGDRRDIPVLARVATDINYRAHVPAITELLTIL